MRVHFLILPTLVVLAACSKTSDKLRVDHNFTPSVESVQDTALASLLEDHICLPVQDIYNHLTTLNQVSMTAYVRSLELRQGGATNAETLDDLASAANLLKDLDPQILIESFSGNTMARSELLQDYLINMTQSGCNATIAGQSFGPASDNKAVAVNAKTGSKTQSSTRSRLDLISTNGKKRVIYRETGSTLVITVTEQLDGFTACEKATNAKYSRVTEYVLVHSGKFNTASLSGEFANLLNSSLDSKSVPQNLSDNVKKISTTTQVVDSRAKNAIRRAGRVELSYDEMGTLQNAIAAKQFQRLSCTVSANGKPG